MIDITGEVYVSRIDITAPVVTVVKGLYAENNVTMVDVEQAGKVSKVDFDLLNMYYKRVR